MAISKANIKKKIWILSSGNTFSKKILKLYNNDEEIKFIHGIKDEKNKIIRKIRKKIKNISYENFLKIPFKKIIFRDFFNEFEFDGKKGVVVIFATSQYSKNENFIKWLTSKYKDIKFVLWMWDACGILEKSGIKIEKLPEMYHKIATFDRNDAKKYNFEFFPQFHNRKILENYTESGKKNNKGVSFFGVDGGRLDILTAILRKLKELKEEPSFYIVKDKGKSYINNNSEIMPYLNEEFLSYEECLEKMSNSQVILEIMRETQTGLTLRSLESLFMEKKLITNNKDILNYDFYNKNNILIIDSVDDITEEFFSTPYEKTAEEILNKYTVEAWVKNIIKLSEGIC